MYAIIDSMEVKSTIFSKLKQLTLKIHFSYHHYHNIVFLIGKVH